MLKYRCLTNIIVRQAQKRLLYENIKGAVMVDEEAKRSSDAPFCLVKDVI